MKPRYLHGCRSCSFMGRDGKYDVYYCRRDDPDPAYHEFIARSGNDPWDYAAFTKKTFADMVANHILDNVADVHGRPIRNCTFPDWMQAILRVLFRTHKG